MSATPDPAATLPAESQALQPVVPLAAAQANAGPLLEQISRNPSVWAWVLALLTGMGVLVAWVRRRPASQEDLFGDHSATAQAPKLAPFAAGLPPQFADLDLNLTPVAAPPTGPKPDIRADIPADLQAGIQADAQKVVRHESPAANPPGSPK